MKSKACRCSEWSWRQSNWSRISEDVSLHTKVEPCIKMIPFHLCLNKILYITLPACVQRETDQGRGPLWSITVNDITVLYRCVIYSEFFSRLHPNVLSFTLMQMEGQKFFWNCVMLRFILHESAYNWIIRQSLTH